MRVVTLIVAALVTVFAVVQSRRATKAQKVEHALAQKPGQTAVPKLPKIKRHGS